MQPPNSTTDRHKAKPSKRVTGNVSTEMKRPIAVGEHRCASVSELILRLLSAPELPPSLNTITSYDLKPNYLLQFTDGSRKDKLGSWKMGSPIGVSVHAMWSFS